VDKKEIVEYWLKSAELDLPVMDSLLEKGNYVWCLFIGHLVIEKTLKAIYAQNIGINPPRTHDLIKLSEASKIDIDSKYIKLLDVINDFNIEARYPDFKFEFFNRCTNEFTIEYYNIISEIYQCLKSQIK
jgi:HEPN domain-containing protein